MESALLYKVMLGIAIGLQVLATIYAIRLIRRTKYNAIWILCIVGFVILCIERIYQFLVIDGQEVSFIVFIYLGLIISICIPIAVIFAFRLVNYIDRMERQRLLFNKRIMTAVLRTEEKTRLNFAKEMHDGMGPLLSSAKMSLSALSHEELGKEQREILQNTRHVIEEAIRSVREISNNLSPQVLIDFGLAQGIHNFTSRSAALFNINIRFDTNLRTERFSNDIEVIVYRVICELINNSLKHSGCTTIEIELQYADSLLQLQYSDNGCGFNPQAVSDCGMGLSNIASRINSLSGQFNIDSTPGEGMRASATISTDADSAERQAR